MYLRMYVCHTHVRMYACMYAHMYVCNLKVLLYCALRIENQTKSILNVLIKVNSYNYT